MSDLRDMPAEELLAAFELEQAFNRRMEMRQELLRRLGASGVPQDLLIRCKKTGGTLIYERTAPNEITVYHESGCWAGCPSAAWQPIATAPKNAIEVRVKMRDGKIYEQAHWASDLSGEEQPPFQGWYIPNTYGTGFHEIEEPEFWQPRQEERRDG